VRANQRPVEKAEDETLHSGAFFASAPADMTVESARIRIADDVRATIETKPIAVKCPSALRHPSPPFFWSIAAGVCRHCHWPHERLLNERAF
jgi:hypothetical protein